VPYFNFHHRDFLRAKWQQLIMANYAMEPEILLPFVPSGTELDYFLGKTYVSLVGFYFAECKIFGFPVPGIHSFEEVNLRFYVKRNMGNEIRRGVVFISETVPNKLIADIANRLYKEHYITLPTKHSWDIRDDDREIEYSWKLKDQWNSLKLNAGNKALPIIAGSKEEFIFEHYYGYSGQGNSQTVEYKVTHPSWETYPVNDYTIKCEFEHMYGMPFKELSGHSPDSVMLAAGSPIAVEWKRNRI
jgi:uncharacterized protein YqjF (DUF2071 family)